MLCTRAHRPANEVSAVKPAPLLRNQPASRARCSQRSLPAPLAGRMARNCFLRSGKGSQCFERRPSPPRPCAGSSQSTGRSQARHCIFIVFTMMPTVVVAASSSRNRMAQRGSQLRKLASPAGGVVCATPAQRHCALNAAPVPVIAAVWADHATTGNRKSPLHLRALVLRPKIWHLRLGQQCCPNWRSARHRTMG